jgi:LysR family transcriptional regulator, nod-box dependent transcriptional activator
MHELQQGKVCIPITPHYAIRRNHLFQTLHTEPQLVAGWIGNPAISGALLSIVSRGVV